MISLILLINCISCGGSPMISKSKNINQQNNNNDIYNSGVYVKPVGKPVDKNKNDNNNQMAIEGSKGDSRTTESFLEELKNRVAQEDKNKKNWFVLPEDQQFDRWKEQVASVLEENPILWDLIDTNEAEFKKYKKWRTDNKESTAITFETLYKYTRQD